MDMELLQGPRGVWVAIAVQLVLYGAGWAVAGRLIPGLRASAQYWMAFSVVGALTTLLLGQHGQIGNWLSAEVGAVLLVLSLTCVTRAAELFFQQPPRTREHLGALAAVIAVVAWVRVAPDPDLARAVAVPLLLALQIARGVTAVHADLRREFGPRLAWSLHVPLGVLGLAMLATAIQAWMDRGVAPAPVPTAPVHPWLLLTMLVMAGALHFSYAGMAVSRLVRRLRLMSHRDALTGLLNRRAMDELLQQEWQRHQRYGQPFAVVLADIDHFKRVNETLGHGAGDDVLALVAGRLRSALRPTDRLARYGGEQFLVLMPATDHAQALAAAERLRVRVATQPVTAAGKRMRVTLSLGAAQALPDDDGPAGLLDRADQAMVMARTAGRNRAMADASHAHGSSTGPAARSPGRPAGPGTAPERTDSSWPDSGGPASGSGGDRAAATEPDAL